MSDYTPTTEEIQSRYVYAADFTVSEEMDAWGEFDRWLERHDAEVYQRGREDADRWCNVGDIAYRKGREDAAKAVEGLIRQQLGYGKAEWIDDEDYEFVAAARGEGEQT